MWSKINKYKVVLLVSLNLMHQSEYKTIKMSKENGSWNVLDEIERLLIIKNEMRRKRIVKIAENAGKNNSLK